MTATLEAPAVIPKPAVPFVELDAVIHERARLGIMSMLAASRALAFNDLKASLGLTDGNLSVHMRILERAGFVEVEKSFVMRRPRTTFRMTRKGRRAFEDYLAVLEKVTKGVRIA